MNTKITTDVDPNAGMLEDVVNPLHQQYIDHSLDKGIQLNVVNDDYATANQNTMWGLDKMLE
jgi:hypothetical protein